MQATPRPVRPMVIPPAIPAIPNLIGERSSSTCAFSSAASRISCAVKRRDSVAISSLCFGIFFRTVQGLDVQAKAKDDRQRVIPKRRNFVQWQVREKGGPAALRKRQG